MSIWWPQAVTIGGVLLDVSDGSSVRASGDLSGWDDAPAVRNALPARAQQNGAWDSTGFSDARVVTVSGFVQEATSAAAYAVARSLAALRPQSVQELVVDNIALGPLSALVRVNVGVKPVWIGDCAFEYSLTVTAPDMLKYGPATYGSATLSAATPGAGLVYPLAYPIDYGVATGVTPGAVSVRNGGLAAYWPRLRIDGPSTNPTVTMVESGAWVRYNGSLLAGQWLDWDLAGRLVLLNGRVSVRQNVSFSGDWLAVPPGGGSIAWTDDGGDPAALLSVWGSEGVYF
jgi:hypothetical protein